jgi:adenosylhomocysteine nucleosidase
MRIGILGAMNEEVSRLKKDLEIEKTEVRGKREYLIGKLYGHDVVLVFSRWGKVAAASTASTLIDRYNVEFLIFVGVAGGISPELNIGDVVISDALVQYDVDASSFPGIEKFEIPLLGIKEIRVPDEIVYLATKAVNSFFINNLNTEDFKKNLKKFGIIKPKVVKGLVASGDKFIASELQVNELRKELPGLKCVEMEGAAVAQVAYEHGKKFLTIRIISDKANEKAAIDFQEFVKNIESHFSYGIVCYLLKELKK